MPQGKRSCTSNAAVGEHLADQLLLPMALCGGGSFTTTHISQHAETNMDVIARFLPVKFSVTGSDGCKRHHSELKTTLAGGVGYGYFA